MAKLTKKTIIAKIKELDALDINLSAAYIAKMDPTLYKTASSKRYFSGWRNALSAAGIDYTREWKKTIRPVEDKPQEEDFWRVVFPTFCEIGDWLLRQGKYS